MQHESLSRRVTTAPAAIEPVQQLGAGQHCWKACRRNRRGAIGRVHGAPIASTTRQRSPLRMLARRRATSPRPHGRPMARPALVSVSASFTPVRSRSPAVTRKASAQFTYSGGPWWMALRSPRTRVRGDRSVGSNPTSTALDLRGLARRRRSSPRPPRGVSLVSFDVPEGVASGRHLSARRRL
jgi:hypothetical protein